MVYQYYVEIKNRFFLLILTWIFTFFVCYTYKEVLLFLCLTRVDLFYNVNTVFYFIFTDVKEVFSVYLKLIFFISKQIMIFNFVFQSLAFISLGLYKFEYRYLKFIFYSSVFFWFFCFLLLNKVLLPFSWNFFLSFQLVTSFNLHFEAKLNEYLDFYFFFYYLSTFYCQIFLILVFFIYYVNTDPFLIKKFRKFLHYLFVIFSTLVTPPDIVSQILFSFIAIGVFEMLIFLDILIFFLKKN